MKLAFIGPLPASTLLPPASIRARRRKGGGHPAPWMQALCPALARHDDVEARVFLVQLAVKKHTVIERDGVTYECLPFPFPERFNLWHGLRLQSLRLNPVMRRYQPDLVHAFGLETGNAALAVRSGFPVSCFIQGIVEYYAPYYDLPPALLRRKLRLEAEAVGKVAGFVAENEFAASWARGHNPGALVRIIPHPLRPAFLSAAGADYGNQMITVGRLDRRKAPDAIIDAFSRMKNKDARLCIIGGGPLRPLLEMQVEALGLGGRVRLAGHLDAEEIIAELRKSRLFVMASRMDTSPNALSEAHAVGLPVIGTRAGGIPEMIAEGEDGFLVDVDDGRAMAERMDALWEDVDLCRRMGEKGREKVRVLNDPVRIAEEHYAYFRELRKRIG